MAPRLDVLRHRLHNQRLIGAPFESPEAVVRALGVVQAQDYTGAKWGVGQRVRRCADADVEAAFARGAILRTHVLRPTWHFVMPEDIRWMLALTAPRLKRAMAPYDRRLQLDDALYGRSAEVIAAALEGGRHLTRGQLGDALAVAGIEASGQRLGHLMMRAEVDALICSGPRQGKQFTYALLDERAPPASPLGRDEALAALTARYFTGHGPAQLADFAWWSGLTLADAKRGVALAGDQLATATIDDRTYWFAPLAKPAPLRKPLLLLLPNYDEYLIAYRDHRHAFDPATARKIGVRDIVFANLIVRNGEVIGGWRRLAEKGTLIVECRLLVTLAPPEREALEAAAAALGRFAGQPAALRVRRR
jgi:winged helix DNA-binding protein